MYSVEGAAEIGEKVSSVVLKKMKSAANNLIPDAVPKHKVVNCELPLRRVS